MGKKSRGLFEKEFEAEAVCLVNKVERTISEVAKGLEIVVSLLSK
jgi:hypothetical protein